MSTVPDFCPSIYFESRINFFCVFSNKEVLYSLLLSAGCFLSFLITIKLFRISRVKQRKIVSYDVLSNVEE